MRRCSYLEFCNCHETVFLSAAPVDFWSCCYSDTLACACRFDQLQIHAGLCQVKKPKLAKHLLSLSLTNFCKSALKQQ